MTTTKKVTMDLARNGPECTIDAVQGDENSREIAISLLQNGQPWNIAEGTTVMIGYKRNDGSGGTYDTMGDETLAYKYQGNVLTIALAPQVLIAHGRVGVTVCIIQAGVKLNTFSICVNVQPNNGLQNNGKDTYKIAGTVPDSGWTPNKYLGSDENGNVVEKDVPAGGGESNPIKSIAITEHPDGSVTMVNTLEEGTETIEIGAGANGDPTSLSYNGVVIQFSYIKEDAETVTEATE